jgi:hypothetical protein
MTGKVPYDPAAKCPYSQKTETTRGQRKIGVGMRNKKGVRLLAYVTGSVNQELLLPE